METNIINLGDWVAFLVWGAAIILAIFAVWLIAKAKLQKRNDSQENSAPEQIDSLQNQPNQGMDSGQSLSENQKVSSTSEESSNNKGKLCGGICLAILSVIFFVGGFLILGYIHKTNTQKNVSSQANQTTVPSAANTENNQFKQNQNQDKEKIYYMGILPLRNPSTMLERFSGVEKYLNKKTGLNIKLKLYPTSGSVGGYTAAVKDVTSGKIQFAFLAPVTITQAHETGPVEPFACAQKEGSPVYYGHIVVKKDSPYQKIEDLQNKPVCGTSASSTSGNLMPSAMLLEKGIDKMTYFQPFEFLGSHDKAAEAVLAGTMEAGFINEMTFDKYKAQGIGLRSIWRHDAVPEFPFCANVQEVDQATINKVKNALLTMHETDLEGIQAVEPKYEKWVPIEWESYKGIKEAIDQVHGEIFYDLDKWTGK